MRIDVRLRGIDASDALREHVLRRIHIQLSRFNQDVSTVRVEIADINGPKGGVDKRCHVAVRGPAFSLVTIEELGTHAHSAVDVAVERAARAIGRGLERARITRRDGASRRAS